MQSNLLQSDYKIIKRSFFGYSWGLPFKCFIVTKNKESHLHIGAKKFSLIKDPYEDVYSDEEKNIQFLKIESIYPALKFRNKNINPDTYSVFNSTQNLVGFLQNGTRSFNNYWKILDENKTEIGSLHKVINFSGFLYDLNVFLGLISFGLLEFLLIIISSILFPKLIQIKYVVKSNSKVVAEFRRIIKPKSIVMSVKILDVNSKISEELMLAAALRAFPGGTYFYPNNSGVGGSSD